VIEPRTNGQTVLVVTNVGPTILRSYFEPLAALETVRSLVIVRDRPFHPFADNVIWYKSGKEARRNAIRVLGRAHRVYAAIRRHKPDMLMVMHWFPDGFYLYVIARLFGLPLIAHIVGGTAEIDSGARKLALSRQPRWVKRAGQAMTRRLLDGLTAITFTGTATLARFRERGVSRPRLYVARPLVPTDDVRAPLSARSVDIVYVGRIDADKRFDRFLRVLAELGGTVPRLTVRVCGLREDDVSADFTSSSVSLPCSVHVEYLGHVADVRPELRAARVFALSSDSEGLSLAMLEAMGCGTVPVVTDVGDMGVVLAQSGGGVAVSLAAEEISTVERLASAIRALLENDVEWMRASEAAHRYISEHHGREPLMADWRRVLGGDHP
jgi:L-malate glycosyltransferase